MADLSQDGVVWNISLSHDEVIALAKGTLLGAILPVPIPAEIRAAMATIVGYMVVIDQLGNQHGVDVTGVLGAAGAVVTPAGYGIYGALRKAATLVVDAGKTVAEFILKVAGSIPDLKSIAIFGGLATGLLPVTIGAIVVLDWILGKSNPPPDSPDALNVRGLMKATASGFDKTTNFVLAHVGKKDTDGRDQLALLSWQGFLSAQLGLHNGSVYANRPWIKDWELWTLITNSDGTITLKSNDGVHCFGTSSLHDHSCFCNQTETSNPAFTQFKLMSLDNGQVALYNGTDQRYVNVQAS
jgi:hypothetical protein